MKRFLKKISRMLSIIMIITLIPKVAYSEVNDFGENASEIQTNEESNFQEQIGEESNSQEQAEDSQEQIDEKNNSEVQANEGSNSQEQAEDSQERIDEKNNSEVQANEGSNSQEQVEDSQEQIGEKNNSEAQTDEESNSDSVKYPNTIEVLGRAIYGYDTERRAIIELNSNENGGMEINVITGNGMPSGTRLHTNFPNQIYFSIKVFKSDGELKFKEEFTGSHNGNDIATVLNGKEVEYGDIIQMYHLEAGKRLLTTGDIVDGDTGSIIDWNRYIQEEKNNSIFEITPLGLKKRDTPTPKIKVKGDAYVLKDTPNLNSEFLWLGIEYTDEIQKKFTAENKELDLNGIDGHSTGKFIVKYTVTNNFGKSASVNRTVYIVEEKYPNTFEIYGSGVSGMSNVCRAIIGFKNNGYGRRLAINVDVSDEKAPAHGYRLHGSFVNDIYFSIKVFKSNGELKFEEEFKGSNSGNDIATVLNGKEVEYGDIIQLYHKEPFRLELTGNIEGEISNDKEKVNCIFKITPFGLEKCEKPTPKIEVKDDLYIFKDSTPTKEEMWKGIECTDEIQKVFEDKNKGDININTTTVGKQSVEYTVTNNFGKRASVERTVYIIDTTYPNTIEVRGIGDALRAKIKFNPSTRKLEVSGDGYILHDYKKGIEYFSIKIFNSEGKIKLERSYTGYERGEDIANDLNNQQFDYGDIIQMYHLEAGKRLLTTGDIVDGDTGSIIDWNRYIQEEKNNSIFEVTPLGLKKYDTPTPEIIAKDLYIFKGSQINKDKIWEGIDYEDSIQEEFEDENKQIEIKDGNINIEGNGGIDTTTLGKRVVKYTVTNNFGKSASVERTVYIIDEEYPNTIEIHGRNYEQSGDLKDEIKFNVITKKLEVTPILSNNANGNNFLHTGYRNNEYFSIKIFDANGKIKLNETFLGGSTTQEVADVLNNFQFDYGYIIKMFHAEPNRLKFTGKVINGAISQSEIGSKNSSWFLEITPFGLRSDAVVDIPDSNLRAVLNKAIDNSRNDDQIITKSQLVGLTGTLKLENRNISDLTGIQNCINITNLESVGNPITSIEPIKNLTKLTNLTISRGDITSIEPLRGLDNIEYLDISANAISDISPLESLINLKTLWGNQNRISDVSPLKNLPKLRELHLYNQRIILPKVKSVGSKATIGNILKDEDGQPLEIQNGNGYTYNGENNTVTFTEISTNCQKEYTFSKQISAGNTSERFYGTVVQEIEYTDIIGCIAIPKTVEMQKVTDSQYVEGTVNIAIEGEVGYSSIDVTMDPSLELTYNKDKYNKDKVKVDIFNNDTIINSNGEVGTLTRDNKNINLKLKAKKADFKYMNKVEYSGTLEFTFSN